MLTNFSTVRKSVEKWQKIEQMKEDGSLYLHTKKRLRSMKKKDRSLS